MARDRGSEEEVPELNLAPIMNMVVILIPLLLLSVVFLEVGVINITAPTLAMGPPSETPPEQEEEPLNLTVSVSPDGFRIAASGAVLPEEPGCPQPGPTICLADQKVDVAQKYVRARELFEAGDSKSGEKELSEAKAAYNWVALYNKLVKIKKQYPEETIVKLAADPNIPYTTLVQVMDVSRFMLAKESFSKPVNSGKRSTRSPVLISKSFSLTRTYGGTVSCLEDLDVRE